MVDQALQIQSVVCVSAEGWTELHPKATITQDRPQDSPSPQGPESIQESTPSTIMSDDSRRCFCSDPWDDARLKDQETCPTKMDSPTIPAAQASNTSRGEADKPPTKPRSPECSKADLALFAQMDEALEQHANSELHLRQPSATQDHNLHADSHDVSQTPIWFPIIDASPGHVTVESRHPRSCALRLTTWRMQTTGRSLPPMTRRSHRQLRAQGRHHRLQPRTIGRQRPLRKGRHLLGRRINSPATPGQGLPGQGQAQRCGGHAHGPGCCQDVRAP